jgi:ATP-dependent DNA helicase RecG
MGKWHTKDYQYLQRSRITDPEIIEQDGGILVTLFKNKYNAEQLKKMNLNGRQLGAVLYLLEKGSITNAEYQEINGVSRQPQPVI